jgi:hypothetical protein
MTRSELFAAVKLYSNRPVLPDTDIDTLIRTVEGELNRSLREHPRNMVTADYTLTAGSQLLPLPADMMQLLTLRFPRETVWREYTPTSGIIGTTKQGYINRGRQLELNQPVSDNTTFILDYFAALCPITVDNSTNWVLRFFSDVYVYGVLKELAAYLKDDEHLVLWTATFGERLQSLQMQGWGQNIAAAPSTNR